MGVGIGMEWDVSGWTSGDSKGAFSYEHLYLLWIPGHIDLIERVLIE